MASAACHIPLPGKRLPGPCSAILVFWLAATASADTLEVEIHGLEGELKANVEAFLGIVDASERNQDEPALTGDDIRRLHRSASGEIEQALQPFGYYDPRIEAALEQKEQHWVARYAIDSGPATRLREVTLAVEGEGSNETQLTGLIENAGIAQGDVLRHPAYSNLKKTLLNDAYALGYLDGDFRRSEIAVAPGRQSADVTLVFDTGPRYYFGDITIEQSILSPDFIDQFVHISPGEVFEPRRLTDLQLALSDSQYFRQAEVDIQREKTTHQRVPVVVRATPDKPQRYETSLGYGTDTGPRGGLSVLWRRVNQYGHQFRTDLRLSAIQSTIAAQYKVPVGDVRSEYLDFTADADKRDINDVDATSYSLGTSLNQNRWGGRRRLSLALEHETWAFGDLPREEATLLLPGIEYSRIIADDLLFTRRGYDVELSLHGASEDLLSDATFVQAFIDARWIRPLGERGRLLLRGQYGATASDQFERLPPSQRFYTGGAQSVRGYGFEELSPRDGQGNLVGGQYLGVASVEVDYLVYGDFGLALFVDSGNASDSASIDWKTGAGIGLRYKTPVGMVRVDFAHPFDDPDSSFAFHISFGPDLQ